MRKVLVILAVLAVSGCEKESAKAERQAEMVENTGDRAATCEAKRKVEQAYLAEGNEAKYRDAKLFADVACMSSKLDPSAFSAR